ncbi:MAG: hypothetical protein DKM50_13340 [Candidatus Margulisiibacteriota bacterium]|nr:MAG: hypothetical protein DKM50_13340 [Candidatus Margulisiibacteriota bacterium]
MKEFEQMFRDVGTVFVCLKSIRQKITGLPCSGWLFFLLYGCFVAFCVYDALYWDKVLGPLYTNKKDNAQIV